LPYHASRRTGGSPAERIGCGEKRRLNEFEHTLLRILAEHGMSLSELANETGYNPIFFEDVVSGKSRKIPVDFFVRLAEVLELSNQEKDQLLRSWAFGVER
jgi:hypothetical protein